jgi:tetratricopeptide (TPR) repeat protein
LRYYTPGLGPDWYTYNLGELPAASDSAALVKLSRDLGQRYASHGQKYFAFALAKKALDLDQKSRDAALAMAHAAFLLADLEDKKSTMLEFAECGMAAAEKAGDLAADPEASYYYALHLGMILNTKGIFALGKLPRLHEVLKVAAQKPDVDMGGPLRVLGMLYLSAPAWPQGIGDIDRALELLQEASERFPAHPQNHLFYARVLIEEDDYAGATKALDRAAGMAIEQIWGPDYHKKWSDDIALLRKKIPQK